MLQNHHQQKLKVLFLCTHNSCRSQMAEGWARHLQADAIEAYSAGTVNKHVDPRAAQVMAEAGVDLSSHQSKTVDDLPDVTFDYVVTVCDAAHEACPVFPAATRVLHAGFPDPPRLAAEETDPAKALDHYRAVRDRIRRFIETLPEALTRG